MKTPTEIREEIEKLYHQIDSTEDIALIRKNGKRIVRLEGRLQQLKKKNNNEDQKAKI